jgi:prophage regulatory protein
MAGFRHGFQRREVMAENGISSSSSPPRLRILRRAEVLSIVPLSDASLRRMEKDGRFPKRIRLGSKSYGWAESEVLDWIRLRMEAR